jgi:hypothetical protein
MPVKITQSRHRFGGKGWRCEVIFAPHLNPWHGGYAKKEEIPGIS